MLRIRKKWREKRGSWWKCQSRSCSKFLAKSIPSTCCTSPGLPKIFVILSGRATPFGMWYVCSPAVLAGQAGVTSISGLWEFGFSHPPTIVSGPHRRWSVHQLSLWRSMSGAQHLKFDSQTTETNGHFSSAVHCPNRQFFTKLHLFVYAPNVHDYGEASMDQH